MSDQSPSILDLAPGDKISESLDFKSFEVIKILNSTSPEFNFAYECLWREFGIKGELEHKETLSERFLKSLQNSKNLSPVPFYYEMILVKKDSHFAAVRDHTIILDLDPHPEVFVHLSHLLIDPYFRKTGLAGWMRAYPLQTTREFIKILGLPNSLPVTLIAEMEPYDIKFSDRVIRLNSYEKAGFRKIASKNFRYYQPDFQLRDKMNPVQEPQFLQLDLVIRRVHREHELTISNTEFKRMVKALYSMYSATLHKENMKILWDHWDSHDWTSEKQLKLIKPSDLL